MCIKVTFPYNLSKTFRDITCRSSNIQTAEITTNLCVLELLTLLAWVLFCQASLLEDPADGEEDDEEGDEGEAGTAALR